MDSCGEEPTIDAAAIERLRELGGQAFVIEMADIFARYVPGRLAAAREALARGDMAALAAAIHPLKSSAGSIGARRMIEAAKRAERAAMDRAAAELPALVDRLASECGAALARLDEVRQTADAPPGATRDGAAPDL